MKLELYKSHSAAPVGIGIGTDKRMSRFFMSDEEALQLAYRLMSLASGGCTTGVETVLENDE